MALTAESLTPHHAPGGLGPAPVQVPVLRGPAVAAAADDCADVNCDRAGAEIAAVV